MRGVGAHRTRRRVRRYDHRQPHGTEVEARGPPQVHPHALDGDLGHPVDGDRPLRMVLRQRVGELARVGGEGAGKEKAAHAALGGGAQQLDRGGGVHAPGGGGVGLRGERQQRRHVQDALGADLVHEIGHAGAVGDVGLLEADTGDHRRFAVDAGDLLAGRLQALHQQPRQVAGGAGDQVAGHRAPAVRGPWRRSVIGNSPASSIRSGTSSTSRSPKQNNGYSAPFGSTCDSTRSSRE